LETSATASAISYGYGDKLASLHIVVSKNVLERCGYGVRFNNGELPFELLIDGNWIYFHVSNGIALTPTTWELVNHVVINGNLVRSCTGIGIICAPDTAWAAGQSGAGPVITNNRVTDNATSGTPDIQIQVGTDGVDRPGGVVLGNDCVGAETGSIALYTDTAGVGFDTAGIDWEGHASVMAMPLPYGSVPANGTRFAHNNAKWYHT
jgi:hypothetical protein